MFNTNSPILLSTITSSPIPSPYGKGELGEIVSGVGQLAEMLGKYGPLIGILAVVLMLFIVIILYLILNHKKALSSVMKTKDNQDELIESVVNTLLAKIPGLAGNTDLHINTHHAPETELPPHVAILKTPDEKKDIVARYIDTNIIFKDASRILLNTLKCERVAVYVFHNGNRSNHGLPFFKMSCISEWTMRGSGTTRGKSHLELPLHIFSDIIEYIYNDGEYAVSDIKNQCIINNGIASFVQYSSIESLFILGISDEDGVLAGFTIAEFKDKQDFADKEIYKIVKDGLKTMSDNIKTVVIDYQSIFGPH